MKGAFRKKGALSPEDTAKRDARIVDALRDGVTASDCVRRFAVPKEYVRVLALNAGVATRRSSLPLGGPT